MPDKIVTATRIVDVSAEQYAEAHRILGSLIKQQSRLLSDALNQRVFLNSSQPLIFSYYVKHFLGMPAYAQWRPIELDEATGLATIPHMSSCCGVTKPRVEHIVKIDLTADFPSFSLGAMTEKFHFDTEEELSGATIMVSTLTEDQDGQPICQDVLLSISIDELLRDVAKQCQGFQPVSALGSVFGTGKGYIQI